MGITQAAVHLPTRHLPDKELARDQRRAGFSQLRVPAWDEDGLTMAIEAGLALQEDLGGIQRVHLATDRPHDQSGLVLTALDLEATLIEHAGPLSGVTALTAAAQAREPTLILAGGLDTGGAGVALRVDPEDGVASAQASTRSAGALGQRGIGLLATAVDHVDPQGPLVVAKGQLGGRTEVGGRSVWSSPTDVVGSAGAAGPLLALAGHLAQETTSRVLAAVSGARATVQALSEGTVPVVGLEDESRATTAQAIAEEATHEPVPWHQASQGAYVSIEAYEEDPVARYGARRMGPGEVVAVTTIQAGPPGEFLVQHEASGPYDVAIVELEDAGSRVIGQVADAPGTLAIGDAVHPVLRRLFEQEGAWRYALKWKPA